jgi:hypothetical protein
LKQQILDSVDKAQLAKLEGNLVGHAVRSVRELLNHLVTRHSQIRREDIKNNKKKLAAEWSPTNSLKELWISIHRCCQFTIMAQEPISDGKMLGVLLDVIEATGAFSPKVPRSPLQNGIGFADVPTKLVTEGQPLAPLANDLFNGIARHEARRPETKMW